MDKHLNSNELQLQSLLETKDFADLTTAEREKVLATYSEIEYNLQRSILTEAAHIYPQKHNIIAPPLAMTRGAATSFWFKKAPVYQTMLAVAATILFMFLIHKPQAPIIQEKVVKEYVSQVDTVVETKIIYDTFVKYVDKPVIVETIKYVETPSKKEVSTNVVYANNLETGRVLEPAMNINLPDLNESNTSSSAKSFKNDPTSILVEDFVLND